MSTEDDITANRHKGNAESVAANKMTNKQRDTLSIIELIRDHPDGLTCDEASVLLGMPIQTCSARFSEMKRDGMLVAIDLRRLTRAGCWARVCTLTRFVEAA